ncbi:MAG: cysteine hydrolase [Lachnospiraceae bacterium]|nr:cysteine hydrolase [Lachnospiraceae bacterium]MCI9547485.1 cysteine hydrolase [Lachnospiraceae bacterium]
MKVLVVVDMQNDFIDGALGTAEAQEILPRTVEKVRQFHGKVVFTRDTHEENYLETQEGRKLPVKHCIRDTEGWRIHERLRPYCTEPPVDKVTFGSVELGQRMLQWNREEKIDSIELVGLCTDICVISNAIILKACLPETEISVDSACCAGVTPESHERALKAMESCQITVTTPAGN